MTETEDRADVDRLRSLAAAATPGPWQVSAGNTVFSPTIWRGDGSQALATVDGAYQLDHEADAAYIAAANPAAITELLDERDTYLADYENSERLLEGVERRVAALTDALAAAEAKVAGLEEGLDALVREAQRVEDEVGLHHDTLMYAKEKARALLAADRCEQANGIGQPRWPNDRCVLEKGHAEDHRYAAAPSEGSARVTSQRFVDAFTPAAPTASDEAAAEVER